MILRMIHNPEDSAELGFVRNLAGAVVSLPVLTIFVAFFARTGETNYAMSSALAIAEFVTLVFWAVIIIPSSLFISGVYNLLVMPSASYPRARKTNIVIIWVTLFPVLVLGGIVMNSFLAYILY